MAVTLENSPARNLTVSLAPRTLQFAVQWPLSGGTCRMSYPYTCLCSTCSQRFYPVPS